MTDLILLAAGASRRFGRQKLLAEFAGRPLYRFAFDAARELERARVLVVTRAGLLDGAAAEYGFETVLVPEGQGQGVSVAAGARAARAAANLCFFVCDQPHMTGAELERFLAGFARSGKSLGRCRAGDRYGSPTVFAPRFRQELAALSGDERGRGPSFAAGSRRPMITRFRRCFCGITTGRGPARKTELRTERR